MLSLSILNDLRNRGKKTKYLVFTPFLKMFPIVFEEQYIYEENIKKVHRVCLKINLYLDINRLFNIQIIMKQNKIYIVNKKSINKPKVYINVEPIYEYGNEEWFLPKIETIKIIKNKEDLILEIKKELKNNNWQDKDVDILLKAIKKEIFTKKKINNKNNMQVNAINKEVNKLVEYFENNKNID